MSASEGFPVYGDGADLPATRPPRPAAPGHLVGRAEGSTTRSESRGRDFGDETILSFRLLGSQGQRPREVQLRGRSIAGTVRDGDWVEVDERERSGRLEVDVLQNLTTGAEVRVSGSSTSAGARVLKVVFLIVFVLMLLAVVGIGLTAFGVLGDGWPFGDGGLSGGGGGEPLDPGEFVDPGDLDGGGGFLHRSAPTG